MCSLLETKVKRLYNVPKKLQKIVFWEYTMIVLISGASHTGKTTLAQKLLEKYKYPYFSIDHLKMGLIRSGNTSLTALSDDEELTDYLWPIVCEIIKTVIENEQNLIVEGCYIPFDWQSCFEKTYLQKIKHICLCFSERYIREHFDDIRKYESVTEKRICDDCTLSQMLKDNAKVLNLCRQSGTPYILIDEKYEVDFELEQDVVE